VIRDFVWGLTELGIAGLGLTLMIGKWQNLQDWAIESHEAYGDDAPWAGLVMLAAGLVSLGILGAITLGPVVPALLGHGRRP